MLGDLAAIKRFGAVTLLAFAAFLGVACSPASAAITFTEGADTAESSFLQWNFGDANSNVDCVDEARWRPSTAEEFKDRPQLVQNNGACGSATEFWGESYGNADSHGPTPVVVCNKGSWEALSARTVEANSTAPCSGDNPVVPVRSRYTFFDTGPASNSVRIERRWSFAPTQTSANPAQGMRAFVPRLYYPIYNQEIYPKADHTLITEGVQDTTQRTDWDKTWIAINALSTNAGILLLRDPSDTSPANLVIDYDGSSGSNNSGITLDRPLPDGWRSSLRETEFLCFYDATTWPVAERTATRLPDGCAAVAVPVSVTPPTLSVGAGNPRAGEQFTASPGVWENATGAPFGYQWSRCPLEGSCEAIAGATGTTYTATSADAADSLKVTVTATAPGGEVDSAASNVSGSISGHVYEGEPSPAKALTGAPVQVCRRSGSPCRSTATDSDGFYEIQVPVSGKYRVTAFPPASSKAVSHTRATVARVRPEAEATGQDVVLPLPALPPPEVGFSGSGVRGTSAEGVPVVHWQEPFVLEYETYIVDEVEAKVEFTDGSDIRYHPDQPVEASPEDPEKGIFKFHIAPLFPNHGAARITIIDRHPASEAEEEKEQEEKEEEEAEEEEEEQEEEEEDEEEEQEEEEPEEEETPEEEEHEEEREETEEEEEQEEEEGPGPGGPGGGPEEITFPIYIDPSGLVRTIDGTPITGATVTLYRADNKAGPFTVVPDGSAVMSPMNRQNPDLSEADGHFGWDVIAGFYKVRAEKSGCHAPGDAAQGFVETDVQTIPPPVTDLDMRLDCTPPPSARPAPPRLRPTLILGRAGKIAVSKSGAFTVKSATIGCPAESRSPCTAGVSVTAVPPKKKKKRHGGARQSKKVAALKLGATTLTVLPGKTLAVSGKVSASGLAKLKSSRSLKATIAVSASVPDGESGAGTISATLTAPPARRR